MKRKICTIAELQKISVKDNGEALVEFAGVLVRESVAEKLFQVQSVVPKLIVTEGYRSPSNQERYFLKQLLKNYDPKMDFNQLLELTHQCVALPSVAGHPTGGAVDVSIEGVDMGCAIADFSCPELMPTFSPIISSEQKEMRLFLLEVMVSKGFAPFYGEWWHFSCGDREWAAFYGYSETFYSHHHGH